MLEKLPVEKWRIDSRKFLKLVVAHQCNTGIVRGRDDSCGETLKDDMAGDSNL